MGVRRPLVLLVLTLAGLAAPAAASAATVAIDEAPASQDRFDIPAYANLVFTAAAREANVARFSPVAGRPDMILVEDLGAPLIAGHGCVLLDPRHARCTAADATPFTSVNADAGDGDDQVTLDPGLRGNLIGGAGNDVLTGDGTLLGGEGDDRLTGGEDRDFLKGGPGRDQLSGAGGDDELSGDGAGVPDEHDTIDGGAGTDIVFLDGSGTSADLSTGTAGSDSVAGLEDVGGTKNADDLRGDDGPNVLYGEAYDAFGGVGMIAGDTFDARGGDDTVYASRGDDFVSGGDGNDLIKGFGGNDVISGGDGDDVIHGGRGGSSEIRCGAGADSVAFVHPGDFVSRDCESTGLFRFRLSPIRRYAGQKGTFFHVASNREHVGPRGTCGGTLWALSGAHTLSSRDFTLQPGTSRTVVLPFSARGRSILTRFAHPRIALLVRPSSHCRPRVDHHSGKRAGFSTSP